MVQTWGFNGRAMVCNRPLMTVEFFQPTVHYNITNDKINVTYSQ